MALGAPAMGASPLAAAAPPPGPSGGGGGRGGRRRRRGCGRRTASTPPLAPAGVPWPSYRDPWSGHLPMWPVPAPGGPRPPAQPAAMFAGTARPFPQPWIPPAQAFSTMGVTPPVSPDWIADSGASFHTTPHAGILSSVRPPIPLVLPLSWSAMALVFRSPPWVPLPVLSVSLMCLLLPTLFTIFFPFANSPLTIPVLSILTHLGLL